MRTSTAHRRSSDTAASADAAAPRTSPGTPPAHPPVAALSGPAAVSAPVPAPVIASEPASDSLFNLSLAKGLQVLRAFSAAHRSMTLAEIAQAAGMTKASAQRSVHTLQALGYIGKHPSTRRFVLLPRVVELGFNYLDAHPMISAAHTYLAQLARQSGETATLSEPAGTHMVYLAQVLTTQHIPVLTPVGTQVPLYASSCGRAYLSQLPAAQAQALLQQAPMPPRTRATLTTVDAVMEQLAQCQQTGYATNCEELFLGDMGIAAPVFNARGVVVGAIHLAPPTSRWNMADAQQALAPLVIECARAVSQLLPAD
ncbi:IclR family transcriptional regulator [Comamonas sediminis]|uniref:IclR family transcriptional regulator n=1 Tax=Comamonas sediminis TaxID=1783360 RepID=UPI003D285519